MLHGLLLRCCCCDCVFFACVSVVRFVVCACCSMVCFLRCVLLWPNVSFVLNMFVCSVCGLLRDVVCFVCVFSCLCFVFVRFCAISVLEV